jgi:GT2 family glycosyltransferase
MSDLSVSIVVPIWGDPALTDECLAAIHANTVGNYTVILVDNTGRYEVKTLGHLGAIFRQHENIGCARAKILGGSAARSDVVVFLDCDTAPHEGWLEPLLAAFDDPRVAMAGPTLVYPSGEIQCACIRTWHGNGSAGGENRKDWHASNSDEDGCTGACMAIRRSVLLQCPIDPQFANTYDDVDLDLQVKEAGWKIAYVAESVVTHHESATGPERWASVSEIVARMNAKWCHR